MNDADTPPEQPDPTAETDSDKRKPYVTNLLLLLLMLSLLYLVGGLLRAALNWLGIAI